MTYSYERGLRDYTKRSDEKMLLANAVHQIIVKEHVLSLVDIGAGEGTFSSMVAPAINDYVAIEKRKENAEALRFKGLNVVEADFPTHLDRTFDMALAAHSIPTEKDKVGPFVEGLIKATKENGVVCIITYKTDKDLWYEFANDVLRENWHGKNYDTYEMLFDILKRYGDVSVERIDATAHGKNPAELFTAIRFIYAGKDPDLAERFKAYRKDALAWLKKREVTEGGHKFPFYQYVITLKKKPHAVL